MALLTSHSSANKVRKTLPSTQMIRTLVFVNAGAWIGQLWQVETIVSERFSYVGMTEAAATTCAAAMVSAYTKNKLIPAVNESGEITYSYVSEIVADVQAVHVAGSMWQVDVSVREKTITLEPFIPEAEE